jgi:O-antigen/teichoic acid export membrane protein
VFDYLRRLVRTGVAYQAGDILSKGVAVFTLPLYTRYVPASGYGYVETLLTAVILLSIVLRLGVGEAFIRFYYDDAEPQRRTLIAAGAVGFALLTTTLAALAGVIFAGPLSRALLGVRAVALFDLAMLGIWAFTNLEIAYALLRADERTGTYMRASLANVTITISLTIYLVVGRHLGARGLLAGNYAASTVVLLWLWWVERDRLLAPLRARRARARSTAVVAARRPRLPLRAMLAFGLPTVPADASVYALQVADRWYLLRAQDAAAAGLYALAAKLATVVFVAVRGFQYAWPPLAYSVTDDDVAARLYAVVTTYYVLATGVVVAGVALLGRWAVRLLLYKDFGAHDALPWLALGWALYGLYLIFVVIAGRARRTRRNLPAALVGLAVNIGGLFALVPPLGISGAGIALAIAYTAMIAVIYLLTRNLFSVGFEWGRLTRLLVVLVGVSVAGELLLPTSGAWGFLLRALAWCAIFPLLRMAGFFSVAELARIATLAARIVGQRRGRRP